MDNSIRVGSVVKALAGREKDRCFVAVAVDGGFVQLADGRERKLEKPKRKSIKHISPAMGCVETEELTNKKLRRLLAELSTRGNDEAGHR